MKRDWSKGAGDAPVSLQCGAGLIELMLANALSLAVLLMALALLQRFNADFIRHEQTMLLEENSRYAIDLLTRAIRQAGYVDYGVATSGGPNPTIAGPAISIRGADNSGLQGSWSGFDPLPGRSVNGSDILAVHFVGAGLVADGSMINCAGFAVVSSGANTNAPDQGWSIFHVAEGVGGEPELRCKYQGSTKWDSQAIVRGVESFQVLYGLDIDGDGSVNQYVSASAIHALDAADPLADGSYWHAVRVIKIGLMLRTSRAVQASVWPDQFDLFGPHYSQANGKHDIGSSISLASLPADSHQRLRLVIEATIFVRNTLFAPVARCAGVVCA